MFEAPPKKPAAKKSSAKTTENPKKTSKASKASKRSKVSAEELSTQHRDISVSEFFTKNRHLLGFDNASRALLTSVKEAVDNALDACEEAGILPAIDIRLEQISDTRYAMEVEDNGPGIIKQQIPKVFGKLLYGSKFHRLRQSRGQQGIGISAAGMYGQLTTGKPVVVTSKISKRSQAHHYHLTIDTKKNKPLIVHDAIDNSEHWMEKSSGTSVRIEMEATYKGGKRSVDEFIQQVAFANPHVHLTYWRPNKAPLVYPKVSSQLPPESKEIKPHPHGIELGMLMRMMSDSDSRAVGSFLKKEFSRVTEPVAKQICENASLSNNLSLRKVGRSEAEKLYRAIGDTKIMAPPTNCLAPIGETAMLEGLKALLVQQHFANIEAKTRRQQESSEDKVDQNEQLEKMESQVTDALAAISTERLDDDESEKSNEPIKAGIIDVFGHPCFITAVSRNPKVYRGNPFQIEAALAYGGELDGESLASVHRFANRVPLLYQQGACALTQAVNRTNWKSYNVQQSRGALPSGPMIILIHIASVWVPFTSEAKEAVAHYDEIITELKFALQECGRRLGRYISRKRRIADAVKKQRYIEKYIPHIGIALQDILALSDKKRDNTVDKLTGILERSRKL
ncbi:MAG: DNA topoisomerase VI subunit B [Myxococcota bacterium]|nr:DNA topoisomerase VI subunit B [Myxococcota bacterium]